MSAVVIVMGLVVQGDRYHLQLRNGAKQVGALDLIGCFGGKVEPDETHEQAICRELIEESNISVTPSEIEYVGSVDVQSDRHGIPVAVHSKIYKVTLPLDFRVKANEGELITLTDQEVRSSLHKLTPATRACFEQLII